MESKSEELKSAGELVKGMHELFEELSDEVHVAESDKRAAEANVSELKDRAARAHRNYVEHKLISAELKNEVRDGELNILELQIQVNELSETIDYLYKKLDESMPTLTRLFGT
jgi:chromosome segregation ATPase